MPPKSSAQCRHKMEKLRKRYRTEKQRSLSLTLPIHHLNHPQTHSRSFSPSSWLFFDLMDSMETGSDPTQSHIPNAIVLTTLDDLKPKPTSKDELGKYFDEILMGMTASGGAGNGSGGVHVGGPIKIRVKNHLHHQSHQNHQNQSNARRFEDPTREDDGGGCYGGGGPLPPPGFKRMFPEQDYEEEGRRSKRTANGESTKRRERERGRERERDSVGEMVSSIRMLGEGLVRMEKMKMEMMREIERMRMEMEMKRSEMILESQQLIVNAFVEGLKNNRNNNNNNNNKKVKVMEVE